MSGRRRSSIVPPKDQTRLRIERMEAEREERRRAMVERKKERAQEEQRNIAAGNPGDVDFIGMVRKWRQEHAHEAAPHDIAGGSHLQRICICVRKRPINDKERSRNDHDSVTCINPVAWIHSAKMRVDGITKYLDHTNFRFDHAFDEYVSTEDVYKHTTLPLLNFVCSGTGGCATVFAYGQTGSGKTYTMSGLQQILCEDLYLLLSEGDLVGGCTSEDTAVMISFFELYAGVVQDLLNDRARLRLLEDGKGEIIVTGLKEVEAYDIESFQQISELGNNARTTHMTEANDTSSRSHAICQIMLRERETGQLKGKLSLVDLAGSERGSDTKSHNAQRRAESADINTSLLALKECIRALDMNKKGTKHVPYRASKLTLILKDCFTSERAMTTMIATISPGASAADHSLNTLRYADRIKEKRTSDHAAMKSPPLRQVASDPMSSSTKGSISASISDNKPGDATASSTNIQLLDDDERLDENGGVEESPQNEGANVDVDDFRDQAEMILNEEEAILNLHMSNIQENAELLSQEGILLKRVQSDNSTDLEVERYVSELESILERREDMILAFQDKLNTYRLKIKRNSSKELIP